MDKLFREINFFLSINFWLNAQKVISLQQKINLNLPYYTQQIVNNGVFIMLMYDILQNL